MLEGRKSYIEFYIIMGTQIPLWVWCAILNAPENKTVVLVVLCLIIFPGKKCMHSNLYFLSKMWLCSWGGGGKRTVKTYIQFKHLPDVLQTFLLMLLTGLWVLEVHLGSWTPTCYHAQDATDLLGALSSSDFFREPVMKTGKTRPTLKHL